jgi:hypothetical protein
MLEVWRCAVGRWDGKCFDVESSWSNVGLPRLVTKVAWILVYLRLLYSYTPIHVNMAEAQSEPVVAADSGAGSQTVDRGVLLVRLDELLEKYLHTLDEYQNLRLQLSKQLSSVSYDYSYL